jgi:hypothetical protein
MLYEPGGANEGGGKKEEAKKKRKKHISPDHHAMISSGTISPLWKDFDG